MPFNVYLLIGIGVVKDFFCQVGAGATTSLLHRCVTPTETAVAA